MAKLVELAKQSVENYIKNGEIAVSLKDLPKDFLTRKAGVFVTIEKNGGLRGCIGTYLATRENIAEETIYNAISAATEDYRFGPIRETEFDSLSYTVYILGRPELVRAVSKLNPKKFGIIVKTVPSAPKSDGQFQSVLAAISSPSYFSPKSALLLPDLDGVDTIEKQVSIACQKGGIDLGREKIVIYRFEVEKYQ